jgi:hypothetical protein
MTDLDSTLSWVRSQWTDLLQRVTGRYYDPSMDALGAVLAGISLLCLDSLRRGSETAETGLLAVGILGALFGWMYIRQERRWRS